MGAARPASLPEAPQRAEEAPRPKRPSAGDTAVPVVSIEMLYRVSWKKGAPMESLGEILNEKGRTLHTIWPTATVFEAVEAMASKHIGALLVCAGDAPVGILSERDVMNRVLLERLDPAVTLVKDVMTREVVCAELGTPGEEAMALMTEKRCRHLPVVSKGRVEGMVSIGDLVRCAARDYEFEARMLMDYVSTGAYVAVSTQSHHRSG
jgi:CBS domain-containing protein